jgi:hypothetical protein
LVLLAPSMAPREPSVVDPTCLARLKWEMEWALRTFIEKPSWRQPHYRTQDENPNPNPNPNGRLKKNCGVILLFRNRLNLAPGAPRALRLDARGESFGELQQQLGSKISDLGSSSFGVQEPGGHRILLQTTKSAEAAERGFLSTLLIREFATTSREPTKDVAMRTWVIRGVCCVSLRMYQDVAPDPKLPLSSFPLVASLKCHAEVWTQVFPCDGRNAI